MQTMYFTAERFEDTFSQQHYALLCHPVHGKEGERERERDLFAI